MDVVIWGYGGKERGIGKGEMGLYGHFRLFFFLFAAPGKALAYRDQASNLSMA